MGGHRRSAIEPETLGGLLAKELDVWCWCWGCSRSSVLATAELIDLLGAGFPVPAIGSRLRCARCGGRQCDTRVFSEKDLADLTVAIGLMNAYNRMAISFRTRPQSP